MAPPQFAERYRELLHLDHKMIGVRIAFRGAASTVDHAPDFSSTRLARGRQLALEATDSLKHRISAILLSAPLEDICNSVVVAAREHSKNGRVGAWPYWDNE